MKDVPALLAVTRVNHNNRRYCPHPSSYLKDYLIPSTEKEEGNENPQFRAGRGPTGTATWENNQAASNIKTKIQSIDLAFSHLLELFRKTYICS